MSISSMTDAAISRRADFPPLGRGPKTLNDIAQSLGESPEASNPVTTAMKVIATYIPTEVLTLYVAVLAAVANPKDESHSAEWITFYTFLAVTPLVVWIVYATKVKSANKPIPLNPAQWPLWEMIAATIAYTAWAFALPNSPFTSLGGNTQALAGVIVLVVSTALGLVAPLFQRVIKT
jgi:hypothetical protein